MPTVGKWVKWRPDAFVEVAGANAQFPLLSIELRHLGGELRTPRPEHGALDSIDADRVMFAVGMVPTPELEAPVRAQVQAVRDALAPWAARHVYLNFAETQQDTATFWTEQAYHRLRRIKAAVDQHRRAVRPRHLQSPYIPRPGERNNNPYEGLGLLAKFAQRGRNSSPMTACCSSTSPRSPASARSNGSTSTAGNSIPSTGCAYR
jgi:hypothetical protein